MRGKNPEVDLGLGTHIGMIGDSSMPRILLDTGHVITLNDCTFEPAVGVPKDVMISVKLVEPVNIYEIPDHELVKTVRVIPDGETLVICWFEAFVWNKKPAVFAVTKRGRSTAFIRVDQINFPMYRA